MVYEETIQRVYCCTHTQQSFAPCLFTFSHLLILRCLVAVVEQLEVQVLVLLEEILKLILLGKKNSRKKHTKNIGYNPRSCHD